MWLADSIFRQRHLSDRSVVDALVTGDRPAHLERCDLCAARAVGLGRWLDEVRMAGHAAADAAFPAERLQAQRDQILTRLELLDLPARVLAFPRASQPLAADHGGWRVAPGWVGVAAAACLALGFVSGQFTARLEQRNQAAALAAQQEPARALPISSGTRELLMQELDTVTLPEFEVLSELTPRLVLASNAGG